ncbi:hypothetical protein ABFX02_08G032000 [Erythranthe guttata]
MSSPAPSTKSPPPPATARPHIDISDIMVRRCVHMNVSMLRYAMELAHQVTRLYDSDGEIAAHMQAEFDRVFGQYWHCIVNQETTPDSPQWCGAMYVNLQVGPTHITLYKISATA